MQGNKKLNLSDPFLYFSDIAEAQPAVTWYYRGSSASNGTTLTLNTLSSLVLGCVGTGKAALATEGNVVAFVITKGSPMSTFTPTSAAAAAAAALKVTTSGTTIYDSINGNTAGYDYILISSTINAQSTFFANGVLSLYIPSIISSDAGNYYCNFIDGSVNPGGTLTTSFMNSGLFSLTVTTKSGSGSQGLSCLRNKPLEYSLFVLGASKLLF